MKRFFKNLSKKKYRTQGRIILSMLALAVLGLVFILVFVINWGMGAEQKQALLSDGTFLKGVSIEGTDLSGKTYLEAENLVILLAKEKLQDLNARFRVGETIYTMTGAQLGALVDYQSVLEEAMLFGRDGSILADAHNKKIAETEGVNFTLPIVLDESVLESGIQDLSYEFDTTVRDAEIRTDTYADEEDMTTGGEVFITDAVIGRVVDKEKLKESILAAVEAGVSDRVILASWEETLPSVTKEDLEPTCQLMASYMTEFTDSSENRIYNIWKMSTVVNGVTVQPGESWSINAAAGDRTLENGWKEAPGIKNGAYEMEAGGGICQVSTTLYITLISAEVNVTDRTHHSWPLSYAPAGLDATISSGSPDLVFENNYGQPIRIVVKCDGTDAKSITVEIYGPPMDYTVSFETEIIKNDEPAQPPVTVVDESMAAGESEWTKPRHNLIVVSVWKIKKDKETGAQIGEREFFSEETYKAFRGEVTVGPSAA